MTRQYEHGQVLVDTRDELSAVDITNAYLQCELQSATSPDQFAGMVRALEITKQLACRDQVFTPDDLEAYICTVGKLVEGAQSSRYRTVPVVFASGNHGLDPEYIPDAMHAWAEAFCRRDALSPEELYYEFELIHPFVDGNGRAGHCLWLLATFRQTGVWPEVLPPDMFAHPQDTTHQSAFGRVE